MNWKGNIHRLRLVLLVTVFGFSALFVWGRYLSKEARIARMMEKTYTQAAEGLKKYEEDRKNDVIGGKTPEETLHLFAQSLREGNIEHAARFFVFTKENDKKSLEETLARLKRDHELENLAKSISRAEPYPKDRLHSNDYKFVIYDASRTAFELYINMEFNPYAGVWKIESL